MIPLANHLWQSTLCVAAVWLLTLALRRNRAAVRYALWLAASIKFLVPFSLLVSAGTQFGWRAAIAIPQAQPQPQLSFVVEEIVQPFAVAPPTPATGAVPIPMVLFCIWLCGFTLGIIFWFRRWRQIRDVLRAATPLHLKLPIRVLSSPARLEPGVFGILKPVLLLPAGIAGRLTPDQLTAVIAHELSHVRRRDNLTAAIHMVVEAVFWFHPLVWWIRERLIEERERACDEDVLRTASDPHDYAEGILNVCKFYLESPLPCVSGITGSDLKRRIEEIMTQRITLNLNPGRKFLLAAAGLAMVAGPVGIGLVNAPPGRAQSPATAAKTSGFEVASIKPSKLHGGGRSLLSDPSGRFTAENATLRNLITYAYNVRDFQVSGGPRWIDSDVFDIVAKPETRVRGPQLLQMVQTLLADRFKLKFHRETKELPVFALVIGKNGPKFKAAKPDGDRPMNGIQGRGRGELEGLGADMGMLARRLAAVSGRTVIDRTGLTGKYDFKLQWTPDAAPPMRGPDEPASDSAPGPSLFSAIQEQLGLKLESQKGPVEILVIDSAERPAEN